MDLSRCHNGGMASGIVFPRHPTTPPSELLAKNGGKNDGKNGTGSINPKTSFFSISNLVNGLRQQQQEKGKIKWVLTKSLGKTGEICKNILKLKSYNELDFSNEKLCSYIDFGLNRKQHFKLTTFYCN